VSGNETKLEDVVKEMKGEIEKVVIESEEMKDEISGVKNETKRVLDVLENVVNASKITASNQHNAEEVSLRHLEIPEYMRFRAKQCRSTHSTVSISVCCRSKITLLTQH